MSPLPESGPPTSEASSEAEILAELYRQSGLEVIETADPPGYQVHVPHSTRPSPVTFSVTGVLYGMDRRFNDSTVLIFRTPLGETFSVPLSQIRVTP